MKHVYALLIPIFLFSGSSSAQWFADNITAANPLLFVGKGPAADARQWQKELDQVTGHISNGKLNRMRNLTGSVVAYFHDSCITDGQYSPAWHGEYFSDKGGSAGQMKFAVQCDFYGDKAKLSILANDISSLLMEPLVVNGQQFLAIKPVADPKKDCPYFEYAADGAVDSTAARVWLVSTVKGQLPYIPVTRAAYLRVASAELTAIKNGIIANMKNNMPVRTAAIQEADKKAALEQLGALYSGMDLQVRTKMFLGSYKTDEDYLKENIDKGTADLERTLHFMDSLLNRSTAAELNKPAIVSVQAADFRSFEDGHGDKMLVKPNPAWSTPGAGGEKPQFLLVRWQYDPSESMANAIDKEIRERFDAGKLREAIIPAY